MRLSNRTQDDEGGRGQILALFALSAGVILMLTGLVIDGGNALNQRRNSQNTSDFAALAGARIIAQWIDKDLVNGTDANVRAAIETTVRTNGSDPVTFGADGPAYVDASGDVVGHVGEGSIDADTVGVRVQHQDLPHLLPGHHRHGVHACHYDCDCAWGVCGRRSGWRCVSCRHLGGVLRDLSVLHRPGRLQPRLPAAGPDAWLPQHSGRFRVAEVRSCWQVRGVRPRHEHHGRLRRERRGSCRAKSGRPEQLWLLHQVDGGPSTDANPIDRIGSLPGNKAAAELLPTTSKQRDSDRPRMGLRRQPRCQRLVPHHRICRFPDHRMRRRQEHLGRVAEAVLPRPDHLNTRPSLPGTGGPTDPLTTPPDSEGPGDTSRR